MNMYMKKCTRCNEEKYLTYFYGKLKLNDVCQDCTNKKSKDRRKMNPNPINTLNFRGSCNAFARKAMKRYE